MSTDPSDPALERTVATLDGRTPAPPDEFALARTQTPTPALEKTLTPLPPALERTLTPLPPSLEKTLTPLPQDLERTVTPTPDVGDVAPASPLAADTLISNGDGASRRAAAPAVNEDRRVKDLVKARLFRNKAKPVKIGRFTILDRLGEGGMGIVYTAYDDKLDRKVAVKVLRGEATRQDVIGHSRLRREAQAMARLSHPNIVTVHEVGELDDQVFVAMEFVRGASLDQWLRGESRPWRDIVDVFRKAGLGLDAAHRAGIVHRDFKPHNVLVGDDGAIKVLDFGLARAAEHPGSEELSATPEGGAYNKDVSLLDAPLTRTGAIMGTPAYMAPEQHKGRPATAQSDQFSFCISLFEGLYGIHPFDCTTLAALVRDVSVGKIKEPPSTSKVPGWLRRILVRGLAVEPDARYPSMAALLADLARDPAAQRRRWLASAGLAGFVGAASFGAAMAIPGDAAMCQGAAEELAGIWDPTRAETVESAVLATNVPYAADTWSRVQPRLDAYARDWIAMRTEACETHRAAKQSDQLFDLRTACLDQRRESFSALVDIFIAADLDTVQRAVTAVAALPPIDACGDSQALTQAVPPPHDPDTRDRVAAARATLARAKAHEDAGQFSRGLDLVAPLLAEAEAIGYRPLLGEVLLRRGGLKMATGEAALARQDLDQAERIAVAVKHDSVAAQAAMRKMFVQAEFLHDASGALDDAPLVEALVERAGDDPSLRGEYLNNLGVAHLLTGQLDAALDAANTALALKQRWLPEDDPEIGYSLSNLGLLFVERRQFEQAIDHFTRALDTVQRTLGPRHPAVASIHYNLGYALRMNGMPRAARTHQVDALALHAANFGTDAPGAHYFWFELGFIDVELRDYALAAEELQRAEAAASTLGDDKMLKAISHEARGELARAGGDLAALRSNYQAVIDLRSALYGAEHIDVAHSQHRYGTALLRVGRVEEAMEHLRAGLELRERLLSPKSPAIAESLELVGRAELLQGHLGPARDALERSAAIREASLSSPSVALGRSLRLLGELGNIGGARGDAVTVLRRSLAELAAAGAEDDELAEVRFVLAQILVTENVAEARALASEALTAFQARGPAYAREAGEIDTWLKGQAR